MKRREFIAVLGGPVLWPLTGHAQQPERMQRVGVLMPFPEQAAQAYVTAFTQALGGFGWVEGKNIRIDFRFGAGDPALFKTYAAELVDKSPHAILASTAPALMALRQQTRTIPIVFVIVPDPVGLGVVQSLARPGGNITGFSSWDAAIIGKWLQLLKEVAPGITRVAAIFNPDTIFAPPLNREIEAASSLGVMLKLAPVHDDAEIEQAISALAHEPGGGLICLPDPFNVTHMNSITTGADRHRLPSIGFVEFSSAGGLMSYWYNPVELHAQAASYIDRILKGANPGDLPVQQPTKYSLIINLKTAKTLGLTVPPNLLDLADEVIE